MKKIIIYLLFIILITIAIFSVIIARGGKSNKITDIKPSVTPSNNITVAPTSGSTSSGYSVNWLIVRDPAKIFLYSNIDDKLSSVDAVKKYSCTELVSAGFWSEENGLLGLFISEGKKLKDANSSDLLNGYFWVDNIGISHISPEKPESPNIRLALQSGPILIKDGIPLKLNINNDENARRIVAAKTKRGETIYFVIYSKNSPLQGPKLAEVPELLQKIKSGTTLNITNALNLDGGAHSAFFSESLKITEVARSGSFFCIK